MATIAPASRGSQSSSAAARRVVPRRPASAGTAASPSVQITALSAGKPRTRDALGNHPRIAQDRRASVGCGDCRLRDRAQARKLGCRRRSRPPAAGMDDAYGDALFRPGKAREIGLAPDDRKGMAIDLGAVADIIAACRQFGRVPFAKRASKGSASLPTAAPSARVRIASPATQRTRSYMPDRRATSVTGVGPLPAPATFLASADMQHNPLARRDERREFERFSLHRPRRIGAGRRARTGDDCEARVAWHRGAMPRGFERGAQVFRAATGEAGDDERAPWREPEINGAAALRFVREKETIKIVGASDVPATPTRRRRRWRRTDERR